MRSGSTLREHHWSAKNTKARPKYAQRGVYASTLRVPFRCTWGVLAPTLGRGGLLSVADLLRDAGRVFGLRVLYPRRLVALACVLTRNAAGRPVLGARLLLFGRSPARDGAPFPSDAAFVGVTGVLLGALAGRFWEVGKAFPPQLLEHLPHDGGWELEVKGEVLPGGEHLVGVPPVTEGLERRRDVLRGHEGVAAGRHAQVLEQREVQPPYHTDHGLGVVDAPPNEEARIVAVGPAPEDLGFVDVVVLGYPVLELPEQTSGQNAKVLVAEKPSVSLDVHDAASVRDGQGLFFVLERFAELAHQGADFLLATAALHKGGLVDYQRGLGMRPRNLVEPARRPLQALVVVFEVPDLPRSLGDVICRLDHGISWE